jgi:hypothetical protein
MQEKSVEGLSRIEVVGELGRDKWERERVARKNVNKRKRGGWINLWVGPRIRPIKRVSLTGVGPYLSAPKQKSPGREYLKPQV